MITTSLPPTSIAELLIRAESIAGRTVAELAAQYAIAIPTTLRREKGVVGQLVEQVLGATAASLPIPDFPHLGIELKTIPINRLGKSCESTFVCAINYQLIRQERWDSSLVLRKLRQVLWIPLQDDDAIPLSERRFGMPLLWHPTSDQLATLRQDWLELTELIVLGRLHEITAYQGEYLQIRPKAAHARVLTAAVGTQGEPIMTLPRGFYLRAKFTTMILQQYFIVAQR